MANYVCTQKDNSITSLQPNTTYVMYDIHGLGTKRNMEKNISSSATSSQLISNKNSEKSLKKNLSSHSQLKLTHLWSFLFCKEDVTLLQGALKNCCCKVIFYTAQHINIKKGFACVYHLLRSVARSLIFPLHFLSTFFITFFNTVLTLNALLTMQLQ